MFSLNTSDRRPRISHIRYHIPQMMFRHLAVLAVALLGPSVEAADGDAKKLRGNLPLEQPALLAWYCKTQEDCLAPGFCNTDRRKCQECPPAGTCDELADSMSLDEDAKAHFDLDCKDGCVELPRAIS
ncbi:hypothetical protein ACHAWF_002502 [Thalassiosira exigua]